MAESQKEKLMRLLGCTAEEAEDIIRTDNDIDHEKPTKYDLPKDKAKVVKQYTNVHEKTKKKPITLDSKPKKRKENPTKGGIIAEIAQFLKEKSEFATENVEITNKERMIAFKVGEDSYEVVLIRKNKPKK
jgi:hypothetical protein